MNKNYEYKQTGDIKADRPTTVGHILAHIENARNYFGIESQYWGGPIGLEYDRRFPNYVTRIAREIDMKYSVNQDRMYYFITPHEVDYGVEGDWSAEWPRISRDYSLGIFEKIEPDKYENDEDQVWSWVSTFRYMLHDAMVSYIYAIGEGKHDRKRRKIEGDDDTLRSIAVDIANWKASSREAAQEERRRNVERELGVEWKDGTPYIPVREDA